MANSSLMLVVKKVAMLHDRSNRSYVQKSRRVLTFTFAIPAIPTSGVTPQLDKSS